MENQKYSDAINNSASVQKDLGIPIIIIIILAKKEYMG